MNAEISTTHNPTGEDLKKYKDAEESFESLARALISESTTSVFEQYQTCCDHLQNIISNETNQTFLETLKEVQTSIQWQQNHYRNTVHSSPAPDSQGECTCEFRKYKKIKGRSAFQKLCISVEKQSCTGASRKEALMGTVRTPSGSLVLKDIAGLDHVKSLLRKSVILPLQCPSLFTGGRKTLNHILLYGPPGTGKSKIATAVASESRLTLFSISSADLLSPWVGESEKTIKDLFEVARSAEKMCIIFIDEIDSICRQRTNSEGDYSRRVKNQLLIEMDYNMNSEKRCVLLCATNCPWDLDVAFIRRFQCRLYVPLPDSAARLKIMKDQCKGVGIDMSEEDWQIIVNQTEGYSGADLTNLVMFATQEPLGELRYDISWPIDDECTRQASSSKSLGSKRPLPIESQDNLKIRDIKLDDFKKALLTTPKTVTATELGRFNLFMERTGR